MESRRKSTRASNRTTSIDSKKSKNEKEKDQAAASVDCDVESISSGSSMAECKVVLDRISSASFNTRSRRKSNLTVDNVAAMDSPAKGKRSKVSDSVASDDTGLSRTRASSRLSASQNTPKKETKSTATRAGAATPTRRSTRLVDSIDLTSSPVIPAKRALRSNSVASEDLAPASPSTRRSTRSSRIADPQSTPNKAKVEIESVMTPGRKGRASRLFARQVQEIKEEEEEIETVSIIELDDDSSQSSPKPKGKKRDTAKSETKTSNVESAASSKKIETVPADIGICKFLLVQTSTANLNQFDKTPEKVAQSGDSEKMKTANKSRDAITETAKPSDNLNAVVDTSVISERSTPITSLKLSQALPKLKSTVEKLMAENVENDAIIVDESTLDHKIVDSINVNSDDLVEPEIAKPQLDTSKEAALVIDEKTDNTPTKGNEAIKGSSISTKKTPISKSRRSDLNFMFQGLANESEPKQMTGTDQSMQVEELKTPKKDLIKPKTPSKDDLSLMNVTELVNSPKTDMSIIKLPLNQSKLPKAQTPSKNISKLADMDVTKIASPSTSIIEKVVVNKELTPKQKSRTTEPVNILDSMNVTELVISPKPKQNVNVAVAMENQSPTAETMSPKMKDQTTETTNTQDLMNVTELVDSPKPKQRKEKAVSESKSPRPSISATESVDMDVTESSDANISGAKAIETPKKVSFEQKTPISTPVSDKIASPKTKTPKIKTPSKDLNEFGDMNVTKLVEDVSSKQKTPTSTPVSDKIASPKTKTPKVKTPSKDLNEFGDMNVTKLVEDVSSKQKTPTSTPVSDKIATPKIKTLKVKTPSKDLNVFGEMNVTKLVEEVTVKTATPNKVTENVSASVPETVTLNAEPGKMEGANNQMAKSPSPTQKPTTPKKSPLSSQLADQSINLNLEISKICDSLQSPNDKTEPKKPDIFAIPIDDGKTLDDTVEPMEVDQTQIGNLTSTSSIDEQLDNQLDADDNNVSSVSVSSRKSVQIMTPKAVKNTSGLKRLGTPYPDKKEINAALAREEDIKKTAARFMGYVKDYQEKLKPLTESWNQNLKQVSADKGGTSGIDTLDNKKDEINEQPAKVAVPARNNWSVTKGLIDTDSEPEPEPDNISKIENEDEQSEEESEHGGIFDDEAEAIDDYQSGDSENEEDRRYRKENELKSKGIDIGSDDTDGSEIEEDDSDDDDSFIVNDTDEESQDSDAGIEPVGRGRRFSRIISEETSSDEENEIVTVSMGVVDQEVVVFGQNDSNIEQNPIVEGKKFETMVFKNSNEEESVPKKKEKSDESAHTSQVANASIDKSTETSNQLTVETTEVAKELKNDSNIEEKPKTVNVQEDESNEPTTSKKPKEISAKEVQPTTVETEIEHTTETHVVQNEDKVEPCDLKSGQNETVHESNESDVSTTSLKENETAPTNIPKKMNRNSLPGIKPLPGSARKMAKELSRKSLGNLVPNQQVLTVTPVRNLYSEPNLLKKLTPKASKQAKPKEPVSEKSTIDSDDAKANTSAKSIDSKVASSQEENNNKKPVKGGKAKRSSKKNESLSSTQAFEEQDNVADEAVPCSSKSTMSVDSTDFKKSKEEKRKFVEIDTEDETPTTPQKPVKYLNIINSRSGKFIEEPVTPEKKDKLGFKVTPMTPVNKAFRVEKLDTNGMNDKQVNKSKKRKIVQVEEPALVLPKPNWTVEQDNVQPKKRARNIMTGTTEMIVKSLNEKKRIKSARDLIPAELQRFRESNLYRAGIPRQDSRSLLMDRMKRILSQK